MIQTIQEEVAHNAQAFQAKLWQLLLVQKGRFALMRHQEVVECFDTARDAYLAGRKLFAEDQLFSIEEVTDTPTQTPVGCLAYAMSSRKV
jgi:hypothetical protein